MLKLEESERWRRWKKSENGESDYVQMIIYKEVKRNGVGDLIYRNERKERRGRNTYLDWLMTDWSTTCTQNTEFQNF